MLAPIALLLCRGPVELEPHHQSFPEGAGLEKGKKRIKILVLRMIFMSIRPQPSTKPKLAGNLTPS
jgi:hypothetical protein